MTRIARCLAIATLILTASAAVAQTDMPRLGLSASPVAFVDSLQVEYGDDFTLWVVMTTPEPDAGAFDLEYVKWALLNSCCGGSPALYVDAVMGEGLVHDGDPVFAVESEAETCVTGELTVLAECHFTWIYEPEGPFNLAAAALTAARDCADETWYPSGLEFEVIPDLSTPAEAESWGNLKARFR